MNIEKTKLIEAKLDHEFSLAAELFTEYVTQLGVDLSFQDFEQELAEIKEQYSRPEGVLYIGYDETPIGCFGIRKLTPSICELKRMYIRKVERGKGLGKKFLAKSIAIGSELGYQKMRLDTLPSMQTAIGLYEKMGFYEIESYRFNPILGTRYFEIQL